MCLCLPAILSAQDKEADVTAQFQQECQKSLEASSLQFESILAVEGAKTLQSVLEPLNDLEVLINKGYSKAQLYQNVHPLPQVRELAEKCAQDFSELITRITLSRPLFDTVSAVDVSTADEQSKRYLRQTLRDFKRSGVNKSEKDRDRITKLQEELAGLPEDYIQNHPANENGKILITTDYPDYFPFMNYAENDSLRKDLYKLFRNRGYPQNEKILKNILRKRYELSQILGYDNYAEFITENKMIKNASAV